MPKQKSHSGTKDRFRVTKTGKVLHGHMNLNHNLGKKSSSRKRRLNKESALSGADARNIRKRLST